MWWSSGSVPQGLRQRFIAHRSIATSCRAVVLTRFGGPEVLEIHPAVAIPDLKPREVLVRSRAVSVNPLDTRVSELLPLLKTSNSYLEFMLIANDVCVFIFR